MDKEGDTYQRKKDNDLTLGPVFEDLLALFSFLTLLPNEALAREIDEPTKFDDLVIRVRVSDQEEHFYYSQLKHKDTSKNADQTITWNDLLGNDKKNAFCLREYFEAYLRLSLKSNTIKELSITTTVGFTLPHHVENDLTTDLSSIVRNLEALPNKKPLGQKHHPKSQPRTKYYVTASDLDCYFTEHARNRGTLELGKSYKLGEKGIEAVAHCLSSGGGSISQNTDKFKEFLGLLVFVVNQPHIYDLRLIIHAILKCYFPFHWRDANQESCFDAIKERVLQLFKPLVENNLNTSKAVWSTISHRCSIFEELIPQFKHRVALGSGEGYETNVLYALFKRLCLDDLRAETLTTISPWATEFEKGSVAHWKAGEVLQVLNIYNVTSNSTVIALKIFKSLQDLSLLNKAIIVQVLDEAGACDVIEYFRELQEKLVPYETLNRETFYCVIQFSPFFTPAKGMNETANELARQIVILKELRQWIQFVVITREAIREADVKGVEDGSLEWAHLPEATRRYLVEERQLFIENGCATTLSRLGFDEPAIEDWLCCAALAELIVHNERAPLRLGLPEYDPNLESLYIERHLIFDEQAERQAQQGSHQVQTKVKIHESKLLDDAAYFKSLKYCGRLVIVLDLPGKGKSSLLTSLANRFLRAKSNDRLLLRVDLPGCARSTWDEGESVSDVITAVDFLVKLKEQSIAANLSAFIVKRMCLNESSASVFLLIDGFDEISDRQRGTVLNMMHHLLEAKGIRRIVLATRPDLGLKEKLEEKFQLQEKNRRCWLYLTRLTENDQVDFLVARWNAELRKERGKLDEADPVIQQRNSLVRKYAEALVKFVGRALIEGENILDIPLQCLILSQCFYKELKNYLMSPNSSEAVEYDASNFELLNLYDRFYEMKADILFEEKANLHAENDASTFLKKQLQDSYLDTMKRLSVFHLVVDKEDARHVLRINWHDYEKYCYASDMKRAAKLGFVIDSNAPMPPEKTHIQFVHHSFSEYFFARFLLDNFVRSKSEILDGIYVAKETFEVTLRVINEKIFAGDDYEGMRVFLDRMLVKHLPKAEEASPFASESRSSVLDTWPVIGHEVFNEFLFKIMQEDYEEVYEAWVNEHGDSLEAYESLNEGVERNSSDDQHKANIVGKLPQLAERTPNIAILLNLCSKEYACRSDIREEHRELLAYFMTFVALFWHARKGVDVDVHRRVTRVLLNWFAPAKDLTDKQNESVIMWLARLVNCWISESPADCDREFIKKSHLDECEGINSKYKMLLNRAEALLFTQNV